jgi:hypothetical protein
MRIQLSCNKCNLMVQPGETRLVYSKIVAINDTGVYELKCDAGHVSKIVLRTPKHEMLYLIAGNAILDGYLREAVLSFNGAMERYFEFAIRVLARANKIPKESLHAAWQLISKQSERQIGAFILIWLFEAKEDFLTAPLKDISNQAKLRNDVIHNGKIPTMKECIAYGQHVADVIFPIESTLRNNHAEEHKSECFDLANRENSSANEPLIIKSASSILDSMLNQKATLEDALASLRRQRESLDEPTQPDERTIKRALTSIQIPLSEFL